MVKKQWLFLVKMNDLDNELEAVDAQFHHFIVDSSGIRCKRFADSESSEPYSLLLKEPQPDLLPNVIKPAGLSIDRQWYLFHKIRILCTDVKKADDVAPKPEEQKLKRKGMQSDIDTKPKQKQNKKC